MATLVLSSVGSVLGGPIAGALGGLIGQSIDRSLLGSGKGRGPRLGDLSVQSSSYGSPIPRIFGTMRVAGTVVWSTDLIEMEAASQGGKSSGGESPRSYSVSLAVALSCRPVRSVRRIWADGKLIRGRSGDFKVRTKFRLKTGSEDQDVDPLIASAETIGRSPAYRGTALAVFEELELTEFGNRIPMMTFEVVADEEPVSVGKILGECASGVIDCQDSQVISGFAAYGSSVRDCLEPLVDLFGVDLVERNGKLVSLAAGTVWMPSADELGSTFDEPRAAIEHVRVPAAALPSTCTIGYYDPDRDYQSGQMKASALGAGQREERAELPAVVTASQAKKLVADELARRLAKARSVKLFLPPSRMAVRPGDTIRLADIVTPLKVNALTINGLTVELEASPFGVSVPALPAEAGRHVADEDVVIGRTELALFELPALGSDEDQQPIICIVGSSIGGWKPVPVEISLGSTPIGSLVLSRRTVLGRAVSVLPGRSPLILDSLSSVIVQLVNSEQQLLNADDSALVSGANLALLGNELIQFGRAEHNGNGKYRLSKILRGRFGTEWTVAKHVIGETFALVDHTAIVTSVLPTGAVGAPVKAEANGVADHAPPPYVQCPVGGEAMRPLPPCHLQLRRDCNTLHASWVSRSRKNWAWYDQVDGGGGQNQERFRVLLAGPGGGIELESLVPNAAFDLTAIAAEPGQVATVRVATVGLRALSHELEAHYTI